MLTFNPSHPPQVREQGTHAELLNLHGGVYADLVRRQMAGPA